MDNYYLALLIPIIATLAFYLFRKSQFTWWEFFIPIASVAVVILVSKLIVDNATVSFTEYWGSTVTAVYEEEPYNYWDEETCSREVACGTDSEGNTEYCTEYYDCSHQDDEGPSWYAVTNLGEKFSIGEQTHDGLVRQFGTGKKIIESRKNYAPNDRCVYSDGTKFEGRDVGEVSYIYKTVWGNTDDTRKPYVSKHTYVNKIKASDLTIFNISLVTDEQADSLGLFKYPDYSEYEGLAYPTILGNKTALPYPYIQEKFRRLNGKFGVSNEMRLWVLIFEDKPMSIARMQENYWVKGNMNEMVVCIGVKGNKIQWAHTFSWALSNELTVSVRNQVMNLYQYKDTTVKVPMPVIPVPAMASTGKKNKNNPSVLPLPIQYKDSTYKVKSPSYPVLNANTWNNLYTYLNKDLKKFKRRSFKEFDYLTVEPSKGAIIFIYIFALLISLGINFWVISNEFYDDGYEFEATDSKIKAWWIRVQEFFRRLYQMILAKFKKNDNEL